MPYRLRTISSPLRLVLANAAARAGNHTLAAKIANASTAPK